MTIGAAAGCGREDTLKTLDRVALPDSVAPGATLAVDSLGRAWIGEPGRLTVIDTAGRVIGRIAAPTDSAPRLLWLAGGQVFARTRAASMRIHPTSPDSAAVRRSDAPVARDPRGRWVYTATRTGSVLGLEPGTLRPSWGWPDAGSRVSALAVSPLGDRVYVALAGSERNSVPPSVEVRDAQSGRLLSTFRPLDALRALEAGPDDRLYGLVDGEVVAMRHGAAGLAQLWTTHVGGADALRVSPNGLRVAVLARGEELRLLDSETGKVLQETKQAPRDAAFDVGGRLWVLGSREIRIVR